MLDKFFRCGSDYVKSQDVAGICDIYNTIQPLPRGVKMKANMPWCATFISAIDKKINAHVIPYECSCYYMLQMYKRRGDVKPSNAGKRGDTIFYDWDDDGIPDHVGVITGISNNNYNVLEGNKGNKVSYRDIHRNNRYILAIGVNHWYVKNNDNVVIGTIDNMARDVIKGKYGTGETRRKALGSNYQAVQKRVNELLESDRLEKLARNTIKGVYGNGLYLTRVLGADYKAVQYKVNELLKNKQN